jgi:hypothetical protein
MPCNLPRLAVLACSVFEKEVALHARGANIARMQWFEIGLHDRPNVLRETLQAALHEVDTPESGIDAIVLVYGLCGLGTSGLRVVHHRLVLPRAHDCITVFMGSKERYAEHQRLCPSCFYYSPGWNKARRVPGPDLLDALRKELSKRFDEDDVEYLVENQRQQWAQHDTTVYLDLGTDDAEAEADYARRCAEWLGWNYQRLRGDPTLLQDLFLGRWDPDRFQIVEPGWTLGHTGDPLIIRAEPP